jgi:hypothetical protein
MRAKDYLVISEIGKMGFIIGFIDGYEKAKAKVKEIVEISAPLTHDKIIELLKEMSIATYVMNGNEGDNYKVLYGNTDGYFSTWMDKVDKKSFCIKTFIKGRENFSLVFGFEEYEEELDRLAEIFPMIDIVAN